MTQQPDFPPAPSSPNPELVVRESSGAVSITARITPRAKRDTLASDGGALHIHLRAAPVDGAANEALIALLARVTRLPRRAITITHGETSRIKRIAFAGLTGAELRERLRSAISR